MKKYLYLGIVILLAIAYSICNQDTKVETSTNTKDYLKEGLTIVLTTKGTLGKNLITTIQKDGTEAAVTLCNERAIALTDSMAIALNATVKRVSDKNRNPDNACNKEELAYINQAKNQLAKDGKASPKLIETDDKATGYYPIVTNAMCLQCHGTITEDITTQTLNKITTLYPEDKATGYAANELRGIWVVEMEK